MVFYFFGTVPCSVVKTTTYALLEVDIGVVGEE
jgi:hypothetical protein